MSDVEMDKIKEQRIAAFKEQRIAAFKEKEEKRAAKAAALQAKREEKARVRAEKEAALQERRDARDKIRAEKQALKDRKQEEKQAAALLKLNSALSYMEQRKAEAEDSALMEKLEQEATKLSKSLGLYAPVPKLCPFSIDEPKLIDFIRTGGENFKWKYDLNLSLEENMVAEENHPCWIQNKGDGVTLASIVEASYSGGFDSGVQNNPGLRFEEDKWWRYIPERGIHVAFDESNIKNRALKFSGASYISHFKNGEPVKSSLTMEDAGAQRVVDTLRTRAIAQRNKNGVTFEGARFGIAFTNGFLDDDSGELVANSPDNSARWDAQCDYIPFQELQESFPGTLLHHYISTVFREDDEDSDTKIKILFSWLGAMASGTATKYKKALLLYGEAGAGKSQFLEMAQEMIPHFAQASQSPQEMEEKHGLAPIFGKALNVATDVGGGNIKPNGKIKALVFGETVSDRLLYGQTVTTKCRAAIALACNELPGINGMTKAFLQRFIIIQYLLHDEGAFRDSAREIKDIGRRIATDCREHLYSFAVHQYLEMKKVGRYPVQQSRSAMMLRWRSRKDTVIAWLSTFCDVIPQSEGLKGWLCVEEAYQYYRNWSLANSYSPDSRADWSSRCQAEGIEITVIRGTRRISVKKKPTSQDMDEVEQWLDSMPKDGTNIKKTEALKVFLVWCSERNLSTDYNRRSFAVRLRSLRVQEARTFKEGRCWVL